jgi:hypothetical protein
VCHLSLLLSSYFCLPLGLSFRITYISQTWLYPFPYNLPWNVHFNLSLTEHAELVRSRCLLLTRAALLGVGLLGIVFWRGVSRPLPQPFILFHPSALPYVPPRRRFAGLPVHGLCDLRACVLCVSVGGSLSGLNVLIPHDGFSLFYTT